MFEAVGHPVRALERVAFGPLRLGGAGDRRAPRADPGGDRAPALAWLNAAPMRLVALRGANTVTENTAEAILAATDELMREILSRNALRRRGPRELHLHAHAGPRRRVPGRRGARDGPLVGPAAVRARDPGPGRAAAGHPRADPRLHGQAPPSTSTSATRPSCGSTSRARSSALAAHPLVAADRQRHEHRHQHGRPARAT